MHLNRQILDVFFSFLSFSFLILVEVTGIQNSKFCPISPNVQVMWINQSSTIKFVWWTYHNKEVLDSIPNRPKNDSEAWHNKTVQLDFLNAVSKYVLYYRKRKLLELLF